MEGGGEGGIYLWYTQQVVLVSLVVFIHSMVPLLLPLRTVTCRLNVNERKKQWTKKKVSIASCHLVSIETEVNA